MSKERNTTPRNLDTLTRLAREAALAHGGHVPTIIVDGSEHSFIGVIPDLASTHDERMQQMFWAGLQLTLSWQVGTLEHVYFISEAWMSTGLIDDPPVMPPSQDPERIEVLLISGLDMIEQKASLIMLEMIRDEHQSLVDFKKLQLPEDEQQSAESTLLNAFIAGFQRGMRGKT